MVKLIAKIIIGIKYLRYFLIKFTIKLFADNTMLFDIVKDPEMSANDLNHHLDVIRQWKHQWKLEFNSDPTKQGTEVLFSCKKSPKPSTDVMELFWQK